MFVSLVALDLATTASVIQAPAQGSEPVASPTVKEEPSASEKVVCKVDPEDTFSRIRRRICKPESEWSRSKQKTSPSGAD